MFDGVAKRYDLLNDVLTFGLDRGWRRRTIEAIAPRKGERVLDVAAGTGTSSAPFAEAGAAVFPTDISMGMLRVGKKQQPTLHFVAGDALQLPYADESFDPMLEIGFGSSIKREWDWRVKRGEPLTNLRAFAHLADPESTPEPTD